jgi:hypothetical protein
LAQEARAHARPQFQQQIIIHDKWLHCDFACLLYSKLINHLPKARVVKIINSAVDIEMEFVVDALPVELIEMNSTMMCNYIKFSVLTESWSPLDAIDTSKSATRSHGWRCQPSGED